MSEPLIVFFDTFTHDGQNQENTDCVRFKSGVQLAEVRILPFGSVVESNLSDEPLLGATNPASFDITLYSNSQTNCITLHYIARHRFDEKSGINAIVLKDPVQSNFILFRGKYSTLTVALFGAPILPLNPSLHHGANLSVPPPQLPMPAAPHSLSLEAVTTKFQKVSTPEAINFDSAHTSVQKDSEVSQLNSGLSWSQDNVSDSCPDKGIQQKDPVTGTANEESDIPVSKTEEKDETLKEAPPEVGGLYEDGEIQDIDYEEISSNEELFSEIDEGDLIEDGQQGIDLLNLSEAPFSRFQWRFNPWEMTDLLSASDKRKFPDPCLTLFEMYCVLLDRIERGDTQQVTPDGSSPFLPDAQSDHPGEMTQASQLLLPPPDEWSQGAAGAQFLLDAVEKFPPRTDILFDKVWVEIMENMDIHLAIGLAFLYHTDKVAYNLVNEAIVVWVYTGLDMSAALRQPDSTYIVRHLMAGVNLVGLVTSTTSRPLAWSLLYPAGPSTAAHLDSSQLVLLQVQHRLLNLLESPLITTPLRLAICRSLDQTTRLAIGLCAFLGRDSTTPRSVDASDFQPESTKPEPMVSVDQSSEKCNKPDVLPEEPEVKPQLMDCDETKYSFTTESTFMHNLGQTPYQRLLFLICSTKNSRVVNAYQRLLNKIHGYEMLCNLQQLITGLRTGEISFGMDFESGLRVENQLIYYLIQLSELWRNANELISNPRSSLPIPMTLDSSKRRCHDAYPDLCTQLDATCILDNVTWILKLLLTFDTVNCLDEAGELEDETTKIAPNTQSNFILGDTIADALIDFIRLLITHPTGLAFLASRPESCSRLLRLCLNNTTKQPVPFDASEQVKDHILARFLILGLEMAYKLETLHCIDTLITWARKKGVTGVHSTVARLRAQFDTILEADASGGPIESNLSDALFRLARLTCNGIFASCSSIATDWWDFISPVVASSAATWVADVVGMDDHFIPFLMLLEAFNDQESVSVTKMLTVTAKSSDNLRDAEQDKNSEGTSTANLASEPLTSSAAEVPTIGGVRTTLKQILANPLNVSSLLTTVVLNLLRNGENASYLDRYGPRMALLVSPQNWEDHFSDPIALTLFTRLRTFNHSAAAPFLAWLRDCPSRPLMSLNLPHQIPAPLSSSSFTWFISQLKPLITEFEEALEALIGMETAEDLVLSHSNAGSTTRRTTHCSSVVHGRFLPSGLLMLLRLLRMHVCGSTYLRLNSTVPVSTNPEYQVILSRTQALIELYSANGFQSLLSLVQKIADHFLIQCQATLHHSTCSIDLVGISVLNANISLLLSVLENAVCIIVSLLATILHVRGSLFSDVAPIRILCLAYTCAAYTLSPPGVKAEQLARIRDAVITGIVAYMGVEVPCSTKVEELENSMWTRACKEVITFTLSAPIHYLSGVQILLDLIPLRLPIISMNPLAEADQKRIQSMRDTWVLHIWSFIGQLTGLIELLGATEPRSTNPLYGYIMSLVRRVADLGVSCATALATACLDSLFSVWDELIAEAAKKKTDASNTGKDPASTDTVDKPPSTGSDNRASADIQMNTLNTRAPSARLLLLTCPNSSTDPDPLESGLAIDSDKPSGTEACTLRGAQSQSNPSLGSCEPLLEFSDSTEISCSLCLLYINLQVPACRYALLHLLRSGNLDAGEIVSGSRSTKTSDETNIANSDTTTVTRSYSQRFCQLVRHILIPSSDKPCHMRTQIILLQCLDLMMDGEFASKGFSSDTPWLKQNLKQKDTLIRLAEGLPDLQLCADLVQSLIKHVGHADRDMATLPHALHPLLLLTQHDQGFQIVRDALDSPIAQIGGQHLFASLIQRVNDCFSTENPDCQTTLAVCLQLLQSMVVGRTNLPLTFAPDESVTFDSQNDTYPPESMETDVNATTLTVKWTQFRSRHVSGTRVRSFLGWSGVGDEGKPVRDLHALLEMLTDDEPSLEYLRTGMKNLLSLLSEEFDISECDLVGNEIDPSLTADNFRAWPEPRPLDQIFADRQHFVAISDLGPQLPEEKCHRRLLISQYRQNSFTDLSKPCLIGLMIPGSSEQLTCNLSEMAKTCCNGLSIREELLKCGRKRDSADTAIRHQKRRRGQASIIETGRTSKKFVAPMRGRGFVLRSGPGSSGSTTSSVTAHGSASGGPGASGGRPDPFRSRPLNTSRPPSLHVDDFTKLLKDDNVIEEMPRTRPYRDGRGFRGGRGLRTHSNRSGATSGGGGLGPGPNSAQTVPLTLGPSLLPNLSLSLGVQPINTLNAAAAAAAAAALRPSWSAANRPVSLLPFALDPRPNQSRRDRPTR